MKIVYYPLRNLFKPLERTVVSIGVFDGLHKGHLFLLKKVINLSKKIKGKSVVFTFWPHPQKEKLIYSLTHRLKLLEKIGIDICVVIRFKSRLKEMLPEEFIKNVLLKISRPYCLVVGEDFRFGKGASGDVCLLKKFSFKYGFKLRVIPHLKYKNKIISSTNIRRLIQRGKIKEASRCLAFPFSILGRVIRGEGLGTNLGFPTANLDIDNEIIPPFGVYMVKVKFSNTIFPALCYIGNKPTFGRSKRESRKISFEIHLLDFKGSLYNRILEVEFIKRLRSQKKFSNSQELVQRIKQDILKARHFFSSKF
jgi:riboflavin kinase/FMN adenylyltransferase